MIKACVMIRRKEGLSVEDFQRHWRERHAPLVARMPEVRRYVQSHPLPGGYRKGELVYDGVAEIWADDVEALRRMGKSDAYATVMADEQDFVAPGSRAMILTEDHVIKDGPVPEDGVKNIEFVRHRRDLDIERFQRYWREVHGPLACRIPVLRRYVQSHTRLGGYRRETPPAWDGLAITWFDSVDAMRASARTEAYARTREDEPNFLDDEHEMPFLIAKEHVIVA